MDKSWNMGDFPWLGTSSEFEDDLPDWLLMAEGRMRIGSWAMLGKTFVDPCGSIRIDTVISIICIYLYTIIHTDVDNHVSIYIYIHIYIYIYTYIYISLSLSIYIYIYTYAYIHIHTYIYLSTSIYCIRIYIYLYLYIERATVYVHTRYGFALQFWPNVSAFVKLLTFNVGHLPGCQSPCPRQI